jgi:phospholipase C
MKLAVRSLILLAVLGSALAHAQNPIPFQHIVIVFQENRTPDNLFGSAQLSISGAGTGTRSS